MSIRSLMFVFAVALSAVGCVAEADETGAATQETGGFDCSNKAVISGVGCVGAIAIFPITVDVKNVGVLNNNDLEVLEGSLNHLSILDGGILNHNTILNDAELTVLDDFLNDLDIDVTKNDIDVCALVGLFQFCK